MIKFILPMLLLAATPTLPADEQKEPIEITRIENLERVFLHLPGDYSIMYAEGQELKIVHLDANLPDIVKKYRERGYTSPAIVIKIVKDATSAREMWVEIQCWNAYYYKIILHVDSADAFTGANFMYQSGKTRREGSTVDVR